MNIVIIIITTERVFKGKCNYYTGRGRIQTIKIFPIKRRGKEEHKTGH